MGYKYLFLGLLFYGCESVQRDRRISSVDAVISVNHYVDSVISGWSNIDGFLDSGVQGQYKAYITYRDSIAGKLMIVDKQEENSLIDDSSIYYFSSLGEVIGYEFKGDEKCDLHYLLLFNKTDVISVRKKQVYVSDTLDQLSSCSKKAIAHREVSSAMQFFPSVHYKNLELPACTLPSLSTRAEVSLLSEPSSGGRIIKRLTTDENLVYLGSQVGVAIDTTTWRLWYKVKTADGIEGWIWGAPQFVGEFEG
ncbi:MAG: SH3 domain-containing protein [Taibaiella sp.]|nr:SH3 domain-containing protein [Taibaiella sp.]